MIPAAFEVAFNGSSLWVIRQGRHWHIADRLTGKSWWLGGQGWCFFHPEHPQGVDETAKRPELLTHKFDSAELAERFVREYEAAHREDQASVAPLMSHFQTDGDGWDLSQEEAIDWLLAHPANVATLRRVIEATSQIPEGENGENRMTFAVEYDEGRLVLVVTLPDGCGEDVSDLVDNHDSSCRRSYRYR